MCFKQSCFVISNFFYQFNELTKKINSSYYFFLDWKESQQKRETSLFPSSKIYRLCLLGQDKVYLKNQLLIKLNFMSGKFRLGFSAYFLSFFSIFKPEIV